MRSSLIIPIASLLCLPIPVGAQTVVPDNSLGTVVNSSGSTLTITGGKIGGANLFHSFQQFSIPTGANATFDLINTPSIQTIFSRITGTDRSSIDGLLRVTNSPNPVSLFLMNPNGIVFGPNAKLDVNGSFVGTTADRIQFKDGIDFTSIPTATPLLSVTVPIGLQMGVNPGTITVQGPGHLLRTQSPLLAPYVPIGISPGLRVTPRNSLALVGGEMTIDGAVLTAPEGRVELASLGSFAAIPILQNTPNLVLGDVVGDRANIALSNNALVDVNGINSGDIQVQGRQVNLTKGALLWVQNRGVKTGGTIVVNATDRIFVDGTAANFVFPSPGGLLFNSVSSIINETVGPGSGGQIRLTAPNIQVQDGANVMSRSFGQGSGGEILINAQNLGVMGVSKLVSDIFSTISTSSTGSGDGGNVTINVQNIAIEKGAVLTSATFGSAKAGDVTVNADTIRVSGVSPKLVSSSLSVPSIGGTGNAGNLLINTRTLTLSEGGIIVASSVGPGNAGSLQINATESINLIGSTLEGPNTGIDSAVVFPFEPYKSIFNLTNAPTGSAGDVILNTPLLKLDQGTRVSANNTGLGGSGSIHLNVDRIELSNGSYIAAGSRSGQGGNIMITSDTLQLRNLSRIYTSAEGQGNGGNIEINSNTIVGVGNSDILANAVAGNGGVIKIVTQGLFGLKFRDQLTIENDITASSESGINGTVQINNFTIDPSAALNALPANLSNASQQVTSGCNSKQENRFVVTGRGGIPKDPSQKLNRSRTWEDLRPLNSSVSISAVPIGSNRVSIVEASSIQKYSDGTIALIAPVTTGNLPNPATCSQF